ncbi:hypothetical protein C0J52_21816 [Blattella germanica]|nr:hypothetical protein C0J52_21816 [Blattella germanica]
MEGTHDKSRQTYSDHRNSSGRGSLLSKMHSPSVSEPSTNASSSVVKQKPKTAYHDLFDFVDNCSKFESKHETEVKTSVLAEKRNEPPRTTTPSRAQKQNTATGRSIKFVPAGVVNPNMRSHEKENTKKVIPMQKDRANTSRSFQSHSFHKDRNQTLDTAERHYPHSGDRQTLESRNKETDTSEKHHHFKNDMSRDLNLTNSLKEKLNVGRENVASPDSGKSLSFSEERESRNSSRLSSSSGHTDENSRPVSKSPVPSIKTGAETNKLSFRAGMLQKIVQSMNKSSNANLHNIQSKYKQGERGIINFCQLKDEDDDDDDDDDDDSLSTELPTDFTLFKNSDAARMLVHGGYVRPIQSVADAGFLPDVRHGLRRFGIEAPSRIQMYSWPAIMRNNSTVLVGPPKTGKSLGYIVPMLSLLICPESYSEVRSGNGPLVLILCSGSKTAQAIFEQCNTLLNRFDGGKVRVKMACGAGREDELRDYLANGCEILISTPVCYWNLLQYSKLITNLDRLQHFIVEELDLIAEMFLTEIKKIIMEYKDVIQRKKKLNTTVQVIATSEKWCPAVEQFSKFVANDMIICISGYMEAAVYAKLRPTIHCLNEETKIENLMKILRGSVHVYKTIVVCNNPDEVQQILAALEADGAINYFTAHELRNPAINKATFLDWKKTTPGFHKILVCTDAVLPNLDAYDALWLIHYSLPASKTLFSFRFSCLMNNYKDIFCKGNDDLPDCDVHIFVDQDKDSERIPEIVRLMKRLSVPVSAKIEEKAEKVLNEKECKKKTSLCYRIKAFGECSERNTCPYRHAVLNPTDKPTTNIPENAVVKLKILCLLDASRFSARILEYSAEDGEKIKVSNNYFITYMSVNKHYKDEANRKIHGVPKLGDVCGFESKINVFQRVQVVELGKEDSAGKFDNVNVYFIDEGMYKEVQVHQLLALPKKLQEMKSHVLEVFLCNVKPCDLDTDWSMTANRFMSNCVKKVNDGEKEGKFVLGKVILSLGSTIWVDPLKCCTFLESMKATVTELSFSKELLNSKLAVKNPDHVNNLLKLSKEVNSTSKESVHKDVTQSNNLKKKVRCNWLDLLEEVTGDDGTESPTVGSSITNDKNLGAPNKILGDSVSETMKIEGGPNLVADSHYFDNLDTELKKDDANLGDWDKEVEKVSENVDEESHRFEDFETEMEKDDPVEDESHSSDDLEDGTHLDQSENSDENSNSSQYSDDLNRSNDIDELYFDIVIDDIPGFLARMMNLNTAQEEHFRRMYLFPTGRNGQTNIQPSVPALPAPEQTDEIVASSLGASVSSLDVSTDVGTSHTANIPPLMSATRSPDVLWYQDDTSLHIKIHLVGVQNYYIAWNVIQIRFYTLQNDRTYEVQGELFGPIQAEEVVHFATGLLFQIKLKKAVPGYLWPRLFQSKIKLPWLKYDCEKYKDSFNIELDAQERCERAIEELTSGEVKKSRQIDRVGAVIVPELMSSDDDDDDYEEDTRDLFDEQHDPYDPLS